MPPLTPDERKAKIVGLIRKGKTNQQIERKVTGCSRQYAANVRSKLKAGTLAGYRPGDTNADTADTEPARPRLSQTRKNQRARSRRAEKKVEGLSDLPLYDAEPADRAEAARHFLRVGLDGAAVWHRMLAEGELSGRDIAGGSCLFVRTGELLAGNATERTETDATPSDADSKQLAQDVVSMLRRHGLEVVLGGKAEGAA